MVEIPNQNNLQATQFQFVIHHDRYKHIQWFCQTFDHPSVSQIPVDVATAEVQGVPVVGDKLYYPELNVNIHLDEEMQVYSELYAWIRAVTQVSQRPTDNSIEGVPEKLDISLITLNSSNIPITTFTYRDAFPISLGDFTMDASVASHEPLLLQCSFQYTYFIIERHPRN